ncbi:MAG: NfeD family protein [Oscillospiraceae bacterium]|nr:NfeD family protein [Oscillospiraceae bacterium]
MDSMAIVWICAIVVFVAIEAATVQLVCIWFGAAALVTLAATLLGAPLWLQLTIFPVCTIILLIATRPFARKLSKGKTVRTNADRILGVKAVVIQEINNDAAEGQVKVMGQIWTARTLDGSVLPEGASVTVKSIEGVKVIVE